MINQTIFSICCSCFILILFFMFLWLVPIFFFFLEFFFAVISKDLFLPDLFNFRWRKIFLNKYKNKPCYKQCITSAGVAPNIPRFLSQKLTSFHAFSTGCCDMFLNFINIFFLWFFRRWKIGSLYQNIDLITTSCWKCMEGC